MALHLRRPSAGHLHELAESQRNEPLTYDSIGMTDSGVAPPGYRLGRWSRNVGHGDTAFAAGVGALATWEVHRRAGLVVETRDLTVGSVVAMAAPLPFGSIDVVCRVVAIAETPGCWSFTYGTLSVHPEQGEERFRIRQHGDGCVEFDIVAIWKSRHPLARLAPPIAAALQRAATQRYLDAMSSLVAEALGTGVGGPESSAL